ncbi:MAG: DUF4349 domain-containing protein, partial [Sandaracinaceae bacterium]|nr:DUF4349 domain-containing protein [Sandaracinaceae bacterium]
MRVLALSTLLAPTLLALCSCSSREPPGPGGDPSPEGRERAVSVWMQLAAEGITDDVRALTARHHGYVQRGVEHERSASLELRVPAAELEALRRELRGLGELGYEREEIADVTDEHSDLNARLRNARREEERLLALMEERTHSLADVLAVEARLSAVRERIEQLEATERA